MQSGVVFAREPLTHVLWGEALPLLFAHWRELHEDAVDELTPDIDRYQALHANGVLRVFTARRSDGLLVGYAMFTVMGSLPCKQLLEAQQAAIYVQPDHRPKHGAAFLDYCTEELFSEGVDTVYQIDTVARPLGRLLARKGFYPVGTVWAKRSAVPAPRRFPTISTAEKSVGNAGAIA